MSEERIIPYQYSLPSEDYLARAPLGTTFINENFYAVRFFPIPNPQHGIDLDDFVSGNNFSLWFKQLAFRVGEYCQNDNYPEPSIFISKYGGQHFVQELPMFGTKDETHSSFLISPPKGHEFVFRLHGHAKDYQEKSYFPFFSTRDLKSICQDTLDISAQVDNSGVTLAWRTDQFYLKLLRFQNNHLEFSDNNVIGLGRNYFKMIVKPLNESITNDKSESYSHRRYINETLARHIGLEIVRIPFDLAHYDWKEPIILHQPGPIPENLSYEVELFKDRIYVKDNLLE